MAIQVNGTTVIDNSRQLTNIASVDSTTKSAIESAGVGGSTTVITSDQAISSGSSFTITLPSGYTQHLLYVYDLTIATNGNFNGLYWRVTNSSNTVQTDADYSRNLSTTGGTGINQFGTFGIFGNSMSNAGNRVNLFVRIIHARDSSRRTNIDGFLQSVRSATKSDDTSYFHMGQKYTAQQNNGIYIWNEQSQTMSNGRYRLYGVT